MQSNVLNYVIIVLTVLDNIFHSNSTSRRPTDLKKKSRRAANLRQREENRENDFHNNKRRHERRETDFNDFFIHQNHGSAHTKSGQKSLPPYHDCKCSCNRQQKRLSAQTITSASFHSPLSRLQKPHPLSSSVIFSP